MARIFSLISGSDSVDLIDTADPGIIASRGGFGKNRNTKKNTFTSSELADGANLRFQKALPVAERYKLNLKGSSHDNAATQIQALQRILRKGDLNQLTEWQEDPLYIKQQATNETNTRYAKIIAWEGDVFSDFFGPPFEGDNQLDNFELTLVRDSYWGSTIPGTVPAVGAVMVVPDSPDAENTLGFFSNFRQTTGVLSHIFAFDASATGFSANLVAEISWPWFEVSGSTPAVGDIMYFGADEPFFQLIFNTVVALDAADLTFDVEYWNGSWTDIPSGGIEQLGTTRTLRTLKWPGADDWATTAINGETKFWVRIIIDGLTSWTTSPEQGARVVFAVNNPYVELNATQVHGDVPPLALFRLLNYITPAFADVAWIGMGIKSRGLTNFISRLNAGGDNPASWAETYGTDTTQQARETAPGGNVAEVTFVTRQDSVQRLSISVADATIETDMEGTYRIFLRAKQVGGAAGDVSMQVRVVRGLAVIGETVTTLQADEDIDLFDMGVFSVSRQDVLGDEVALALNLQFLIYASSSNGATPNLEIFDLVLIPVDEQALFVSWPGQLPLSAMRGVQIDSGLLREETGQMTFRDNDSVITATIQGPWETKGAFIEIEPRRKTRIYFLIAAEQSNIIDHSNQGQGMGITIDLVERWNTLRGSD